MLATKLGFTMEVYIYDMLIKSLIVADHITHMNECFHILKEYNTKLSPAKCTFGFVSSEFLGYIVTQRGYIVTQRGIKANLK